MYIIIQWDDGWKLYGTCYETEQQARQAIVDHCLLKRETTANYMVAQVIEPK